MKRGHYNAGSTAANAQRAQLTGVKRPPILEFERLKSWLSFIAHGILTPSMLPKPIEPTFEFSDRKMGVDCRLNKVRCAAPAPAGAEIRGRLALAKYEKTEDGGDKPALVAKSISRHHC